MIWFGRGEWVEVQWVLCGFEGFEELGRVGEGCKGLDVRDRDDRDYFIVLGIMEGDDGAGFRLMGTLLDGHDMI